MKDLTNYTNRVSHPKTTFAVSLHFPQEVNEIITSTVKSIAEVTGNHFITENKIPPHITIGAFHSTKESEEKLFSTIQDFFALQKPGVIEFKEIENFNGKVLFLKAVKNEFLSNINTGLHKVLLPDFNKAENGYYLPQFFFPHTTLATRLNQRLFEKAKALAEQIKLPLKVTINEAGIYQCSPVKKVKSIITLPVS